MRVQEMSALGYVLRYYNEMEEVVIHECGMTEDGINTFKETIGEIKVCSKLSL